jgi:hypothetical protein
LTFQAKEQGTRTRSYKRKMEEKKNTNWKKKKKKKKKKGVCKPTRGKTKWFILALLPPPAKYTCSHTLDRPQTCNPSERMPQKAHEKKAKHRRDRKREYNNSPWVVSPNLFSPFFLCFLMLGRERYPYCSAPTRNLIWVGQISHAFLTGKLVESTASCQTIATLKRASSFAFFNSFNCIHTYIHTTSLQISCVEQHLPSCGSQQETLLYCC